MSEDDKKPPEQPAQPKQGEYRLERPSIHSSFEQMQQDSEFKKHQDLAQQNKTGQGALDGLSAYADAKRGTSGRDEKADEWVREKHGGAAYTEEIRSFDVERDEIDQEVARVLKEQEQNRFAELQNRQAERQSLEQQKKTSDWQERQRQSAQRAQEERRREPVSLKKEPNKENAGKNGPAR